MSAPQDIATILVGLTGRGHVVGFEQDEDGFIVCVNVLNGGDVVATLTGKGATLAEALGIAAGAVNEYGIRPVKGVLCESVRMGEQCVRFAGHPLPHRGPRGTTWGDGLQRSREGIRFGDGQEDER